MIKVPRLVRLLTKCSGPCRASTTCFHKPCQVRRMFRFDRLLIENQVGHVRAVDELEVGGC